MGVKVKISNGIDPFSGETVIRYAEEHSTVINSDSKIAQVNIVIKHYLTIDGVETYAVKRYADFNTYVQANNEKFIFVDNTGQHYKHKEEIFNEDGSVKQGFVLGQNTFGQYDFFDVLRGQSLVFNTIIQGQILSSDNIQQFNNYDYLNF